MLADVRAGNIVTTRDADNHYRVSPGEMTRYELTLSKPWLGRRDMTINATNLVRQEVFDLVKMVADATADSHPEDYVRWCKAFVAAETALVNEPFHSGAYELSLKALKAVPVHVLDAITEEIERLRSLKDDDG